MRTMEILFEQKKKKNQTQLPAAQEGKVQRLNRKE